MYFSIYSALPSTEKASVKLLREKSRTGSGFVITAAPRT